MSGKKSNLEARKLIQALYDTHTVPAGEYGLKIYSDLAEACALAKRHHSYQERFCNGYTDEKLEKRAEKGCETIEKQISALVAPYNLTAVFEGDPRGYTVKLHSKNGRLHNTWGGSDSGYGIGEK